MEEPDPDGFGSSYSLLQHLTPSMALDLVSDTAMLT